MTNPLSESQALSNLTRISNAINGVTIIGGTSSLPANALLDENNNPILDESGDYILAD